MNSKVKTAFWCIVPLLIGPTFAASGADLRLVEAVEKNDQATARALLRQKLDVNVPQADGSTALIWAAHWDDPRTADMLIAAGAKVNAASQYGVTALWEACNNGSSLMVEKLAKAGADLNVVANGETALMTCARTGNMDAVGSLLSRGADVNAKEPARGQTALMWAISEGHTKVVQALVEHGADIHAKSKGGFTPFLFAARRGDIDSARILLEKGADANEPAPGGLNALLVAIDSGHEELAIYLLDKGANPNVSDRNGLTPLHYALRMGITYLESGQREDRYGVSLTYMFRPNMRKLVEVLLQRGANPNARIAKGDRRIQNGSDFVRIRMGGVTPLMLAAATGDIVLVRAMIAKGGDPMAETDDGVTPMLVAAGVGVGSERTPEEGKGALEIVKMLVEMGADVNAATRSLGYTALNGAAYNGANDIIQYLVEKGANLNVKDKMGQTPLSIAEGDPNSLSDDFERRDHPKTAELIRKLGGDPLAQGSETGSVGGVTTFVATNQK
jgi:ankyrin repeat protein